MEVVTPTDKISVTDDVVAVATGVGEAGDDFDTTVTERKEDVPVTTTRRRRVDEQEEQPLSHIEAMTHFQEGLAAIIQMDPLLCDLPSQVTLEELRSKVALEHGQAMTINVAREDKNIMPIVVSIGGTVRDLKNAIKIYIQLQQERKGGVKHISWRYIWRSYNLTYQSTKLEDDNKSLKDYGIVNRDEVTFIKKLKPKC